MIFNGDRALAGRYLRHLADLMLLRDWTIFLADGVTDRIEKAIEAISVAWGESLPLPASTLNEEETYA